MRPWRFAAETMKERCECKAGEANGTIPVVVSYRRTEYNLQVAADQTRKLKLRLNT